MGEPFDPVQNALAVVDGDEEDSVEGQFPRTDRTYAQRRAAFSYTYGDDPVFRGRKIVRGRGRQRGLVAVAGDWASVVSDEDKSYVPDGKDPPNDRRVGGFHGTEITAGDYLTALGSDQRDEMGGGNVGRERAESGCSIMSDDSDEPDSKEDG